MTGDRKTRDELQQLIQVLVTEGTRIVGAFAALHGLHHTDVQALSHVMLAQDRGAPMTAGALAERLGLTSGAITALVDRLERAGHVSRVRDDADRRKVLLHYSAAGRALAEEFFTPRARHIHTSTEQFTAVELEVVRRYLAASVEEMAAHRQSLTPHAPGDSAGRRRS